MLCLSFFFFNDTATTEIYTLSLHDALPICRTQLDAQDAFQGGDLLVPERLHGLGRERHLQLDVPGPDRGRSEEHTSELQSRQYLVCRLLLEKKKTTKSLMTS